MPDKHPMLSLIAPVKNEEDVLPTFFEQVIPILENIIPEWEIIFVNDGSTDSTLALLIAEHKKDNRIKIINLSRNFGKEEATSAGIEYAKGQAIIPIDADLQDPPELIPDMVEKWQEGFKVVLATRRSREGETFFKKFTASAFYKVMGKLSKVKIPANTGDYRLMDRQVVDAVLHMPEKNRMMKNMFAWPGFSTTTIYFDRKPRHSGNTSWNYWRLWHWALDGIFSFSSVPLKIWTYVGIVISAFAFLFAAYIILSVLLFGRDIPGYASLMTVILFLGGIQLISLGIIGEYISRIYIETKNRPLFIISETYGFDEQDNTS